MTLQDTDKQAAAVAKAPRVSLADIESNIITRLDVPGVELLPEKGTIAQQALSSLKVLSICVLVLKNGFTVIGKSAPAAAENFDPALGQKFAYEDAVRQIWPLMGYALRDKLAQAA